MSLKTRSKMNIAGSFTQAAEEAKVTPAAAITKTAVSSTRTGRVACPFWIPLAARQQLKHLATDLNITSQEALTEALNDWFAKQGKPSIA